MSLSNRKEDPNGDIIFAYWGLNTDIIKNEEKKKLVLNRLSGFFSEQELFDLIGNNTILILDIKDELLYKGKDVFYKPWKMLGRKPEFPYKDYLDFSLRKYIGLFWQNPTIKVILNNEEIPMLSYHEQLQKTSKLMSIPPSQDLLESFKMVSFFKEEASLMPENPIIIEGEPLKKEEAILKEQVIIIKEREPKKINEQDPFIIKKDSILKEETFIIKEQNPIQEIRVSELPEIGLQGILVYSEGRLIGRGEEEGFGDFWGFERRFEKEGGFKIQGVLELKEFLQTNVFRTVD